MADIRINSLPTTASASSSDDFLALDGATNGTRKLNAYSPTFGGNLTVSGTGNSSVAGNLGIGETSPVVPLHVKTTGTGTGDFDNAIATLRSTAAGRTITLQFSDTTNQSYISSKSGALNFGVGGATLGMSLSSGGNLTVSGTGTSSVAGNLALNGATSYLAISPTTAVTNNVALQLSVDVADNRAIRMTNTASGGHAYDFIPGGGGDAGSLGLYDNTAGSYRLFIPSTGNLLIGTTIDGGQKLQVSGSALISVNAGGASIGLSLKNAGGHGVIEMMGTAAGPVNKYAHLMAEGTGDFKFYTNGTTAGTAGTLALTLDSSQNATFAGDVGLSGNEKYLNLFSTYVVGSNSRARLRAVGSGGGSGYGGSFTVDTRTSGNTFITALTIDDAQNATFAGQITASGISHKLGSGGTGSANAVLTIDGSSASSYGSYIVLQRNSTNKWQFGTYSGINGGTSDDFLLYNPTAANEALKIAAATSNATFAGSIAIGNTVNTVSPTSPNRTITMVFGGTTYYIHAKTTND